VTIAAEAMGIPDEAEPKSGIQTRK